jgi:hypothetical protein
MEKIAVKALVAVAEAVGVIVDAVTAPAVEEGHERRVADDRELDAQIGASDGERPSLTATKSS